MLTQAAPVAQLTSDDHGSSPFSPCAAPTCVTRTHDPRGPCGTVSEPGVREFTREIGGIAPITEKISHVDAFIVPNETVSTTYSVTLLPSGEESLPEVIPSGGQSDGRFYRFRFASGGVEVNDTVVNIAVLKALSAETALVKQCRKSSEFSYRVGVCNRVVFADLPAPGTDKGRGKGRVSGRRHMWWQCPSSLPHLRSGLFLRPPQPACGCSAWHV